jgi:NAD+ synthase (glutamine-hydrolysing)
MGYKIALSQINSTVGDFEGNKKKILASIARARSEGVKLVIFPELAITGYPPKDLLLKKTFLEKNREVLEEVIKETTGIGAVIGFVDFYRGEPEGNVYDESSPFYHRKVVLHNAACFIQNCKIIGKVYKVHLPNYDVFDEKRYFSSGKENPVFDCEGQKIGINICEDIWFDESPVEEQVKKGADFIVTISASPFYAGKKGIIREILSTKSKKNSVPMIYVNCVGGQDDLIFDGSSYVYNDRGILIEKGRSFDEDFIVLDSFEGGEIVVEETMVKNVFDGLVLGTRDYVRKNNFQKAVVGLSGGIDSALTAVIACESLGKENVLAILMPGPFSSSGSVSDARELAENLGIEYTIVDINKIYDSYCEILKEHFKGTEMDATEENIQARIRGNILMAFSNKFNLMVLSTGNKSELAVGYSTLYGDMAGGLGVISDVPKTLVYELSRYYNSLNQRTIIPEAILEKPPSAELKENQKDSDDLPPYRVLDEILDLYLESGIGSFEIVKRGFERSTVEDIISRIRRNEYKRKQAPLGLKITPKSFGFGRRMPITNKFEE